MVLVLAGRAAALRGPIFAVAELLRSRYQPDGTVPPMWGRRSMDGLTGFAVGLVLPLVEAGVLIALSDVSPIWFIRR